MTNGNVRWAKYHDWFVGSRTIENVLTVIVADDMKAGEVLHFTDIQELAEWAGY